MMHVDTPPRGQEQRSREWLKSDEVADMLGVSVHTVRSWRLRGQGPACYRMFNAVRYDRAEVLAWHESMRQRAGW